ncbi:hypothetical protein ACFQ36_07180 [Arthrobacter sp. GCM10027362]|uniref:hypothetical protein n=1 Tax=Arthrobacter sp. GCM10027362 TaxID=3273379 RepID=UPI00363BF3B8
MTDTGQSAPGQRRPPTVVVQLAEQFRTFGVAKAFGDPVRVGEETVVPVALVQYGFGGGSGADPKGGRKAGRRSGESGGGGGGVVIPLGVLARGRNGRAVFRPNPLAVLVCLVPVVSAFGHAVTRVVRASEAGRRVPVPSRTWPAVVRSWWHTRTIRKDFP